MSQTGYSFYCSRCKFDHAGECAPATSSDDCLTGNIDGSQWYCKGGCGRSTANTTGTCSGCQSRPARVGAPSTPTPGFPSTIVSGVPQVGSRWVVQNANNQGVWYPVSPSALVYVVTRTAGTRVWIRPEGGSAIHSEMEYGLDPWTPAGTSMKWRFLAAGTP